MHKYKLKVGRHSDEFGNSYEPGAIITTSHNLTKLFGEDKFEDLGEVDVAPKKKTKAEPVGDDTPSSFPIEGDDVTDQFPKASAANVVVVKNDDGYHVLDVEADFEVIEGDLSTKKAVNETIKGL